MHDLPIFANSMPTSNPFPALESVTQEELSGCRARFDAHLDCGESASNIAAARAVLEAPTQGRLLEAHRILFEDRDGSGAFRQVEVSGLFEGQDCPAPMFISRSLNNFEQWLTADSFGEIHPVEQAALTLTRLIDIWPFEFGNRTAAVLFSNCFLAGAGYPPFCVLPEEVGDFDAVLSSAVRMQTAPLVKTIYASIERELGRVRR